MNKFEILNYLKFAKQVSFFAFILFVFGQCTSSSSSENTTKSNVDSSIVEQKTSVTDVTSTNALMKSVFYTTTDIERSTFLDQPLSTVFEKETAEPSDSASNFKTFSTYFNQSDEEFVDVQYYNDGKSVTSVKFDIFLNNTNAVADFYKQIVIEMTKKYGKGTTTENTATWLLPNNQKVVAKDVSVKLAPGLQLVYSKIGDNRAIE